MIGFARLIRPGLLAAGLSAMLSLPAAAQPARTSSLTLYDQPDYRGASVTFYGDHASVGSTGFADRARSAQVRGSWRVCEGGGYRNRCLVLDANVPDLETVGLARRVGSAQLVRSDPAPPAAPQAYAPPPRDLDSGLYARPREPAPLPAGPERYRAEQDFGAPARDYAPPPVDAPPADRYGRPLAVPPYAATAVVGPERIEGVTTVFFPHPTLRGADVASTGANAADEVCRTLGLGRAAYFDDSARAPRAVDARGRPVGDGPVLRDLLCRRY